MNKTLHILVTQEGDHGITKNNRSITLTAIVAKVYNALLLNRIQPEIEKILWKNQNSFWRNWSITSHILTILWIIEGVRTKNLEATLLFVDFSQTFDSIHWGKMGLIFSTYDLPKGTVIAIMIYEGNGSFPWWQHRYLQPFFLESYKEIY